MLSYSRSYATLALLGLLSIISACEEEQRDEEVQPVDSTENAAYNLNYGTLPKPLLPEDNPLTAEGVELGRMLFYENALSRDESIACANCHQQENAFSDTSVFSIGIEGRKGKRQAMAVFNMAWNNNEFFWDGRAHLLRDQALLPIQDELEMDETLEGVVDKLKSRDVYRTQFNKAFGNEEITSQKISLALEQFMNSIVSYNSKWDQVERGEATLSEREERGRKLFFAEYNEFFPDESGADCAHCHSGKNFEDDLYLNNGLDEEEDITDLGREAVTQSISDRGKFKVTSLRNIALTPPYMHDGRFKTLREVVQHYNNGIKSSNSLDQTLKNTQKTGLMLSEQDIDDLVAFLQTLTDEQLINDERYSSPF